MLSVVAEALSRNADSHRLFRSEDKSVTAPSYRETMPLDEPQASPVRRFYSARSGIGFFIPLV